MIPLDSTRALATLVPGMLTSDDTRSTARALPPSAATMSIVHAIVQCDIQPVLHSFSSLTSRGFKLALSALASTIDISFTALLAEQRANLDHVTRQSWILHWYVAAWHFIVFNPTLAVALWGHSNNRTNSLLAALSDLLGSQYLPATLGPPPIAVHDGVALGRTDTARTAVFVRRLQLAIPHMHLLHSQFARLSQVRFTADGNLFVFEDSVWPAHEHSEFWHVPPRHELEHPLVVGTHQGTAFAVWCPTSLLPLRVPNANCSRFLPPELHWRQEEPHAAGDRVPQRTASPPPWFRARLSPSPPRSVTRGSLRQIPTFHVTNVISKRSAWQRRFKRYLGQATSVILDGRLCLPLDHHEGPQLDNANLMSCFSHPDHTKFVDRTVSEYLVTGVCSWYPSSSKPIAICPLGVVPKKSDPFFRLIIDARGPNTRMSRWASNMRSLASSAHIFEPGSVVWTRDISKAYIVSALQGCQQRFTERMRADGFKYHHVGCEPDTCGLACSKCLLGFQWRRHYFVFNAPMFGGKLSGNILDTLLAPVDRWIRTRGIALLRWVDDLCMSLPPRPEFRHDTSHCGGFQYCFMCKDTYTRAVKLARELDQLLIELGFELNDKLTTPSQRGEFIGLGWDTLHCTFWMPAAKANKLASMAADIAHAAAASRRDLAKFRGKLSWFSPCLSGVRLLTRALNAFIGNPESDMAWDLRATISDAVLDELRHWSSVLPTAADHERPLWTLRPAQVLELYKAGSPIVSVYMETDASLDGWGCLLRHHSQGSWREHRTSVPWLGHQPAVQVQCEAEALHQALLTFLGTVRGAVVLHVTDCKPTLHLPERGSAVSSQLQRTARDIWLLCSTHSIFLYSAWVPGTDLIQTGTDGLSREELVDPHTATLRPDGWTKILELARRCRMRLSIDWFADDINHQLPVFWSRYHTPGSAGADALSAPSWDHSRCDICQQVETTFGFYFPPAPLLDAVVAKAKLDGAGGVIVVPRSVGSVWWPVLSAAAISEFQSIPALSLNFERRHCSPNLASLTWNCVAFDFSKQPRPDLAALSCQCHLAPPGDGIALSSRVRSLRDQHSRLAQLLLSQ
jgi:hypothetical protein